MNPQPSASAAVLPILTSFRTFSSVTEGGSSFLRKERLLWESTPTTPTRTHSRFNSPPRATARSSRYFWTRSASPTHQSLALSAMITRSGRTQFEGETITFKDGRRYYSLSRADSRLE